MDSVLAYGRTILVPTARAARPQGGSDVGTGQTSGRTTGGQGENVMPALH